jgi:hypothetical protein
MFPVAFLLLGRDWWAEGFPLLRHFLLLLFYGLTFPAACHLRNLTSKFVECIRRYNLHGTRRWSNNIISGKVPIRESGVPEPEGGPLTGEIEIGSQLKEPTPVAPLKLQSRSLASCDGPRFLLK